MKIRNRLPCFVSSVVVAFTSSAGAAEIPKLTNTTALNLAGSWSGGVVPGTGDVMLWNNLYTLPSVPGNLSQLGGNLSVMGVKVTDVGGARNVASNLVGFQNGGSANTLTIGSGGIDLSAAFQTILMQSAITLSADQTWSISNANNLANPAGFNNGEDLALHSQAQGVPINFGGNTVTTTGNGQVTITSGYTLSNGTLVVGNDLFVIQGGSNRITTIDSSLNLQVETGGRLRIQSNSGSGGVSMNSAANVTVNGGVLIFHNNNQALNHTGSVSLAGGTEVEFLLTGDGNTNSNISGQFNIGGDIIWRVSGGGNSSNFCTLSGNIVGSGDITYINTATAANGFCRLTGDNSGYSGALTLEGGGGNRSLRLSSATAGSAAASWNVAGNSTLQVDGVTVELGTLTGGGTITNSSDAGPAEIRVGSGLFEGAISDGFSQTTAVTKVGSGTLTLTNINNLYTGVTTVEEGTLVHVADRFSGGDVVVADGAAFGLVAVAGGLGFQAQDVTLGSSTGATLVIDVGSAGNPSSPPLSANTLEVNGSSAIRLDGMLEVGSVPLVEYVSLAGSGFGGLSLALPPRTTGSLVDAAGEISATITATDQIKWVGGVSNDWDIDPDGGGSAGTLNWLTVNGTVAARFIQGADGSDAVNFDDTATGDGTVNLTAALSPRALIFDNTLKSYTLTGSGSITGGTSLVKRGDGTVTLANTTASDYTGGTVIEAGTLRLGDGVTSGAGQISGTIQNDGTVVLDRPDDFTFGVTLEGFGTLVKDGENTVTIGGGVTMEGDITLEAGKLAFSAGGTLLGKLDGAGELEASGGTLAIQGSEANTNTGLTTVSGGVLQLNNIPDEDAVGGDIAITGGATLAILANEQIPDDATLHVLGTSADSLAGSTSTETIGHAVVNGETPATQMIMRHEFTIAGTGTVEQGILGVASGHNAHVNAVVMTSANAIVRIAGNTAPSSLTVGAGGITASGGDVQVKFNTANQDATLNLEGDVTTTGDVTFTNGNYTGDSANIINLGGARTFNIGAGTTTTVAPDFGGSGSLAKTGGGTLTLNAASSANHTGGTTVGGGTLLVNGNLSGTVDVASGGTLGGTGTVSGTLAASGTIAPAGEAVGTLNASGSVTLDGGSTLDIQVGNWAGTTAGTDWDLLAAGSLEIDANASNKLTIRLSGNPTGFDETAKTITIATSASAIAGFDGGSVTVDSSAFAGSGTWTVAQAGSSIELTYTPGDGGDPYEDWAQSEGLDGSNNGPTMDPDNDGQPNFAEFALNSAPLSGAASGKKVSRIVDVDGSPTLTLTFPVRTGAVFAGATEKSATRDGVTYRVQAGGDLAAWGLVVTEVTGAAATGIHATLPALPSGWAYRTFRSPADVDVEDREFLRLLIEGGE